MSFAREAGRAIRSTLVLWVITALIYPLVMVAVGQIAFPFQANGSILTSAQGQPVGSALIGQPFTSDRYFNSRPSTTSYSTADPSKDESGILKTGVSGASNLAPSNSDLLTRVQETSAQLNQAGIQATADLLYTSGSSLDPHITPEAARAQITRVATARGLQPSQLEDLINQNTDGRFLGIFGEPGVNVLKLNLALDSLAS
ncbi:MULTISPECIES: K(+)-transporting ATPase subunit C [Trichocoleus]|uniref:Potassium-transporting ATPase KdpC subunit n=1 Tax=Trichocoleus desertorum GB2-A4 TaxID=2933944 RepID=A0ABV0JFD9_9CYAN|nr:MULTISPECIES: K(+)-transporting ATPase subunit C [unclassified Trichocoleus]MBD1864513.1 K(+)-transporting ATPase subunit C [Trichocoleus sp. FACHB-46]MBD2124725.1 K(+)-transporting ATPase subunit C [Trichocoleus sp. FACHB-262]